MMTEHYEQRAKDVGESIMASCGADCSVWWDSDSLLWRCRWRGKELSPQVDNLNDRLVSAWRKEIHDDLMR